MAKPSLPLATLSEAQRAQASECWTMIHPALKEGITQASVTRTHNIPSSTIQRWVKWYREQGWTDVGRSDKGKPRSLPSDVVTVVEELALQIPPRSAVVIHHQVIVIAKEQRWKPPRYARVCQIIKNLASPLVTLPHEGATAYREEFDLLYRREATHANAMWQTDHTPLDVWVLDEEGKPARPWLLNDGRNHFDRQFPHKPFASLIAPSFQEILSCWTVFYTAPVAASPERIEQTVMVLCAALSYLVEAAEQVMRELYDRGNFGLMLIACMPG